jgi:hypothetical protein
MILGKIQLNEAQSIDFGMSVFGTTEQPTDIRFVIEGEKFDIVCKCKQVGETLSVDIPELKGILESKEYKTRLEVIIGDKIFTPLKESIEFLPLVEFGLQKKEIRTVKESVEVTVKASSKDVKNPLQENLDKVTGKYEVKQVNNFNVLTKDDLYWGFVSEASIVEAKRGFNTLSELVADLTEN